MIEYKNEHKVCDSKLRSLFITATANAIEYGIDFIILLLLKQPLINASAIALGMQIVCYSCTYVALRMWNKIKWGRTIKDVISRN